MAKTNGEKKELAFVNKEDNMDGFQGIDQSTMAIPFIRVLQSLSPQLNQKKAEYIEGAEEGQFFNTVTKEIYGDTIKAIVLKFERVFIEWLPERGGFVNYHTPENAERLAEDKTFGAWETSDGNSLQENYVYFLLIDGQEAEGVVVLSLSSSAIKKAKEWNRLMTTHILDNGNRALPFYLVWNIKTEYQENDKGNWYSISMKFDKYINEKQYSLLIPERKALPDKRVNYEGLEGEVKNKDEVPF